MKCICDIITTILIIKIQFSIYTNAELDNIMVDNKTVCCPENIDSGKQVRSMNSIEVNTSMKNNSTTEMVMISNENSSTKRPMENKNNRHFKLSNTIQHHREKELPLPIIIAGPAAAVGIFLFLSIAYYFHNMQLNNQAKRLSITLNIAPQPDHNSNTQIESNVTCSQQLIPPSPSPSVRIARDEFAFNQKRKNTLAVPTLTVPPTLQHKRGSSWSAFADQEMLTLAAPRRHSTFII